jgi:GNAT superfamily N-acetyltransferase
MDQQQLFNIALAQSAIDLSCTPEDLVSGKKVVVESRPHPKARAYLRLPFACNLVSYGGGAVASVSPEVRDIVTHYMEKYPVEHLFETPNLHALDDALAPHGLRTCFMAEYFLPDLSALKSLPCKYELRLLEPADFKSLYLPQWSNALSDKRPHLDMLGVGAYDGDTLIGLAGCSADCDSMWQIGIDVLPAYRRQGIAAALTAHLALECLKRDKVPFYCAAWSNIPSVRNAIKAGFRPAWVELTVKSAETVRGMNA